MPARIDGQCALVSGGGRGIGRAIALSLAAVGAPVAVAARTTAEIESVARECRAVGVAALAIPLDVTDRSACESAVARCEAEWGRVDILVNNAGIATGQKFTDIEDFTWDQTIAVDLTGPFYLTRAALPGMLGRGTGTVITIASIAGRTGAPYIAPYVAAKHGVIGLMRALAAEYAGSGVTFNSICPAYADTPMTSSTVDHIVERTGRTREQAVSALLTPQGKLISPEEVASLCVFLAGPGGKSINGQAINIDGGMVQS